LGLRGRKLKEVQKTLIVSISLNLFLSKYNYVDETKEDEMGLSCGTYD
jgi:hypothetical protein